MIEAVLGNVPVIDSTRNQLSRQEITPLMNEVVLTLDTDWAPDFAIDFVAAELISRKIKATWFITHNSPAIKKLFKYPDLFEIGIHPNFLSGSTQGKSVEEVLRYCFALVPKATSMRTHSLFQSTPLLQQIATETTITTDVSLFLPRATLLKPVEYRWKDRTLLRIPYCWEDDFEMERNSPDWNFPTRAVSEQGLKVFNFHPMHIYLNSGNMESYKKLKQQFPRLSDLTEVDKQFVQTGSGARTAFLQLIDLLAGRGDSARIIDVHERWQERSAK